MGDTKKIYFGELIELMFPDGDSFYMPAEHIAKIVSEHWQVQMNKLLCPKNGGHYSIHSSETYEKRKKIAEKYMKEHD